jgi:D-lactate dehydrogenase (cytochrome)
MAARYSKITPELKARILRAVGPECEVKDAGLLEAAATDATGMVREPELVLSMKSAGQISNLLKLANEFSFPVIPRGAGTGLAGGSLADLGGVVICLHEMDDIIEIDPSNLIARVQPGVILKDLKAAAEKQGLFYPPDPASLETCSVGGTVATDAGGPACVKYGTTRQYVMGLTCVLPSGEIVKCGVSTRKGVVGFDLTRLMCGSEGALGILTEITLKLIPKPRAVNTQVAVFDDIFKATGAVAAVMAAGVTPSAVEFIDAKCLELIRDLLPFSGVAAGSALVIMEADGMPGSVSEEMRVMSRVVRDSGAAHMLPAGDEKTRAEVWDMRRQVSLRIHESAAVYVPEDVVVPLNRIAELVDRLPSFEGYYGLTIYAFGHAGDGNVHLNVTADSRDKEGEVEACIGELLKYVLKLGGTISGEHGVGLAKKRFLPLELSGESVRLQREIKRVFDPNLILNPGKLF